jgi:hypothetical protein
LAIIVTSAGEEGTIFKEKKRSFGVTKYTVGFHRGRKDEELGSSFVFTMA